VYRQPEVESAALREFSRLGDGHDSFVGRTMNVERRKAERLSGIVGNHHLDEVLVRVAETQKRNVQRSSNLVHHRIRESQAILRMRGIRVGRWRENCLGRPCHATIGRPSEAHSQAVGWKLVHVT